MKKLLSLVLATTLATFVFSQNNNFWKDVEESTLSNRAADRRIIPNIYRTLSLDFKEVKKILSKAPMRFSEEARNTTINLSIPLPEGGFENFTVVEAPIMHPDLAARYPEIQSFSGKSEDDPTAYLRFGVTQKGFHAVVFSARHNTMYIDAYAEGDTEHYVCYFKKNYSTSENFECHVETEVKKAIDDETGTSTTRMPGDCQFRTYRLALACTGEYAQFHGGNVADVMAAFNVAMTRVNGIYEKDGTVTMELVPNNDELIFLNAGSDPYTNNSGGTMLGQNQTTITNVIGTANYDIGHVFSTGGGGIAGLGVICSNNNKARGVTGLPSPIGDPFYVDYVAHEMGHQFGANHTQNNSCNRNNATAMEPGSASTIMGYAGICSPNVQNNSDDYFHAISLDEIAARVTGTSCPVISDPGNGAPSVSTSGAFYNLPVSTPFALTADAEDPDGDVLTYCWEQMNNQAAQMPPQSTNTVGPAFRTIDPLESPTRYFPNLNAIIAGTTPTWEVLPSVGRNMNFRCTVRDGLCTDEVDVTLSFSSSAGPFLVESPNNNSVTWTALDNEMVTWDVANTNAAPVNTSTVDIYLSEDGGQTYPYLLAEEVSNNGSANVIVPNVVTTQARVMVKGHGNVFFDISDENFTIEMPAVPTYTMSIVNASLTACQNGEAEWVLDFQSILGFSGQVNLTLAGMPNGASSVFSPNPITPAGQAILTIDDLENVTEGTYNMSVMASHPANSVNIPITLTVIDSVTAVVNAPSPADGTTGLPAAVIPLTWEAISGANAYFIEVSDNPSFDNILDSGTSSTASYDFNAAAPEGVYYWRVKPMGECNDGETSSVFAFQTGGFECEQFISEDTPIIISGSQGGVISSDIEVTLNNPLATIYAYMSVDHSWVGDLAGALTAPSGTNVELFDQPGIPGSNFGCDGDDLEVGFSNSATNTAAEFESTCAPLPAIQGTFQSINPMSNFIGENPSGVWTLEIDDLYPQADGGRLNSWFLEMCVALASEAAVLLTNEILEVPNGLSGMVAQSFLEADGAPNSLFFTLLSVPENGELSLNGMTLEIGGQFTQQDINGGLVSYTHDGSSTMTDGFHFDIVEGGTKWLHNQFFQINIIENSITASIILTQELDCHDDSDAVIEISASGGIAPLEYSLNGGAFQASNIFSSLPTGTYQVTVKDANGLTVQTNMVQVNNPAELGVSVSVSDGDLTVNASGGTGTLEYSLDGMTYQASNEFTDLPNGSYTVYVRDENGCVESTTAVIAVSTVFVSVAVTQNVDCAGADNGVVTASAGGGVQPYTYSLNGGPFQSDNTFEDLPPGDYTVTVMDADGFIQNGNTVTVTEPSPITGNASVSGYTVTVNASGGTGSLTYSLDGGPYQGSNEFFPVANGAHSITVKDENDCEIVINASVDVPAIGGSLSFATMLDCHDSTDGTISIDPSGGVGPYEYSLNGGAFQTNNEFTGLSAGVYEITIRDSGGFEVTLNTATISAPSPISATADVDGNDVTVNAAGGTGLLMYSLDGGAFQLSNVFLNVMNGAHEVTIQDANGCETTIEVSVVSAPLQMTAQLVQGISCAGASDATISINASGGADPLQYSIDGVNYQSNNVFENLPAGTYEPSVQDATGAIVEAPSIVISEPPGLELMGTTFGLQITVDAEGGTGDYQYSLNGGPFQSNNIFVVNMNGTYTIMVMDENGCTDEIDVEVNIPEGLFTNLTPVSCPDFLDGIIVIDGVQGGTPPYQFSLNGGPFSSTTTYENLGVGDYVIVVMDATGYEWTAPTVVIAAPASIDLSTTIDDNNLTVNAAGGTGDFEYSIDGGNNFQDENEFLDLPNGTYEVVVRDENGCLAETTLTINYNRVFEVDGGLYFEVLPNPSTGIFILRMDASTVGEVSFNVYDLTGRIVLENEVAERGNLEHALDLKFLSNGTYQLKVTNGGKWGTEKLVVIK